MLARGTVGGSASCQKLRNSATDKISGEWRPNLTLPEGDSSLKLILRAYRVSSSFIDSVRISITSKSHAYAAKFVSPKAPKKSARESPSVGLPSMPTAGFTDPGHHGCRAPVQTPTAPPPPPARASGADTREKRAPPPSGPRDAPRNTAAAPWTRSWSSG